MFADYQKDVGTFAADSKGNRAYKLFLILHIYVHVCALGSKR